jgi:hypothetical protein
LIEHLWRWTEKNLARRARWAPNTNDDSDTRREWRAEKEDLHFSEHWQKGVYRRDSDLRSRVLENGMGHVQYYCINKRYHKDKSCTHKCLNKKTSSGSPIGSMEMADLLRSFSISTLQHDIEHTRLPTKSTPPNIAAFTGLFHDRKAAQCPTAMFGIIERGFYQ